MADPMEPPPPPPSSMLDISLVVGGEDGSEQGPRIYLGSQAATQDPAALAQQHRITRVLSLGVAPLMQPLPAGREALYLDLADVPEADFLALLPPILAFLLGAQAAGGASTLVHCLVGQSRSAAAVLAYSLLHHHPSTKTLAAAHAHLAAQRPSLCVNPGFLLQLAWLEDHVHGRGKLAEYRVALLAEHAPVLAASGSSTSARGVVDQIDATVAGVDAAVAPFRTDGGKEREWRCRGCRHVLFTSRDVVRHGHAASQAAAARMVDVTAAAPPAAAAFYDYARVWAARPLLHVRAQRGNGKKKGKDKGKERVAVTESSPSRCPWIYVQPPAWALPFLLPREGNSTTNSGVVPLQCPGRHCGRAVGVGERLAHPGGLSECECGAATPLCVVRFQRALVVVAPEEEDEEGVYLREAGDATK